jgi:hypothetical protein
MLFVNVVVELVVFDEYVICASGTAKLTVTPPMSPVIVCPVIVTV